MAMDMALEADSSAQARFSSTMENARFGDQRKDKLQANLRRSAYAFLVFLVLYVLFRNLAAAAARTFWYDELLTLTVSSQTTLAGIWEALARPLDGQPPLFYVIERFAKGLVRNQEIALRLPSILALPCTLTCVFFYVKKRSGELVALVCTCIVQMSSVFQYYAAEARPYSMVVACIAFALVCYQRVPSPLWTVLLAVSLALAQSLHYMAVLAMMPFGLAEAVRLWRTRQIRWMVWAALAFGALPLLVFWKLLAINRAYYGPHYWAQFQFSFIPWAYGDFFLADREFGAGIAAVTLAGSFGTAIMRWSAGGTGEAEKTREMAEVTLILAFVALPFFAYVVTSAMHTGLTPRYFLSTVLGVALAFGYILSQVRFRAVAFFAAFVFSSVGVHELHFWKNARHDIEVAKTSGASVGRFIQSAGHEELPVAVVDDLTFIWLVHYVAPPSANRFVYVPQDPGPEKVADTTDKGIEILQSYWPLRLSNFGEFTSANREFLLYVEDRGQSGDWLTLRLRREGWSLQLVGLNENRRLYLVSDGGPSG